MNKQKKVVIVGLGLIGGSLAKALKVNNYFICGVSRKKETIDNALAQNVINLGSTELNEEVLDSAKIIFLCTPLDLIPKYIQRISELAKNPIILTDAGSTKQEICDVAKNIKSKYITFIGGHPMAGTEKGGFEFSQIELFKNCAWIFTPIDDSENSKSALEILKNLACEIGAKPIVTRPEIHDRAVALVSHLPLLASIALCLILKDQRDLELQRLAEIICASGYRDTTRIGGGNPEMNSNLITSNLSELMLLVPNYFREIETITHLAQEDPEKLQKLLADIKVWKSKLYNSEGKNSLLNK